MKNTDIIITNSALIKQKKAKNHTRMLFLRSSVVFFSFVCNWAPIEKPFQKLVLRVLLGFSKHSKTIKALGCFISFLVFGSPAKTLALVFEILHEKAYFK